MTYVALAVVIASMAPSQLPFPLFDQDKPTKPKPAAEKPEKDDEYAGKTYAAPDKKALPEGAAEALSGPIVIVDFKAIVNPGMGEFVISSLDKANAEGAQAVLIEIDTPGGLVSTTQKMVQAIMASKVPVIVFVTPSGAHAASAGTFVTLAAHVAAMSPATRIGAAHPVTGGGKDPEAEGGVHMGRKIENDLAAMIEGIALERGRNTEWAIDAVRGSVSIHAEKAVEIGVVDFVAVDRAELFGKLDGHEFMMGSRKVRLQTKDVKTIAYELTVREHVLNFLANPGIAVILGMLGVLGIMVEVYHPGMIIPGVLGALCIICSMIAMEQLPIDVGGAILIIGGLVLLIAELYTSTYGALGIFGAIGLTVGLLLLVDPSKPDFALDPSFRLTLTDVAPVVIALVGMFGYISFYVMRAQKTRIFTGHEALLGMVGSVTRPIDGGEGMVFIDGEYWRAHASEPIAEQTQVEVVSVEGLLLEVRPKRG